MTRVDHGAKCLVAILLVLGLAGCGDGDADSPSAHSADEVYLSSLQVLGKRIFEDARLSEPPGQACASCHPAARAFVGDNGSRIPAVALGSRPETFGSRNVPTAMYMAFSPRFALLPSVSPLGTPTYIPVGGQFWDGRAATLADQARQPFLNPLEMNNPDAATVVAKIREGAYADLFRDVFGDDGLDNVDLAYQRVGLAVAEFEGSTRFARFSSRFDDYLRGTERLSGAETNGFELFKDPEKGNCIACHVGEEDSHEPADWLFTDFTYDNLGLPRNDEIPANQNPEFYDLGLCDRADLERISPPGFDPSGLCGAFKVPTLRNVAVTAPYGHNGVFKTLRDVVRFYATRDTNPELWYRRDTAGQVVKFDDLPSRYHANVNVDEPPYDRKQGQLPRLNDREIDEIVAFLRTLTDR